MSSCHITLLIPLTFLSGSNASVFVLAELSLERLCCKGRAQVKSCSLLPEQVNVCGKGMLLQPAQEAVDADSNVKLHLLSCAARQAH